MSKIPLRLDLLESYELANGRTICRVVACGYSSRSSTKILLLEFSDKTGLLLGATSDESVRTVDFDDLDASEVKVLGLIDQDAIVREEKEARRKQYLELKKEFGDE